MGPANCAIIGCTNSTYRLKKWEESLCHEPNHIVNGILILKKHCGCNPPYRLYMFPSIKRNGEKRKMWVDLMKRETAQKTAWSPGGSDRVCSDHFVDGIPTNKNPNPALKLGYEIKERKKRRTIVKHNFQCGNSSKDLDLLSDKQPEENVNEKASQENLLSDAVVEEDVEQVVNKDESINANDPPAAVSNVSSQECDECFAKETLVGKQKGKINKLCKQLKQVKIAYKKECQTSKPFSIADIETDQKINFYTGITSLILFESLYKMLLPLIPSITFWRGTKKVVSQKVKSLKTKKKAASRKLTPKNEFLLTLMRLRLGLLNEDLADRFGISPATCSETFKTWVRLLSMTIGQFVKWLPQEVVKENMPKIFKKAGHGNTRVIIDCSEIFIERPKSLETQAATWSDYKSHNTLKFLIGISPTGFISFLSECYGGRASDKYICKDSGFYDLLDLYDEVMADRGFQIQEELMLSFCTLTVPPGARLKSQMTDAEVQKTKKIANLRIHVERAINRVKTFRILKSPLPITMIHHCDDIVRTCAGLCNLKPLLYVESKKTS